MFDMIKYMGEIIQLIYNFLIAGTMAPFMQCLQILTWGIGLWNSSYEKAVNFIVLSPQEFLGYTAWIRIKGVMNGLSDIGASLSVFLWLAGVIRQSIDLKQLRQYETVLGLIIRLILANTVARFGQNIILWVVDVAQGIVEAIADKTSVYVHSSIAIPSDLFSGADAPNPLGSLLGIIATLIGALFIIILSVYLLVIIYGRFFEIYTLIIFAPISLSLFAADFTQQYAIGYLKNVFAAVLKGGAIIVAGFVFSMMVNVQVFETGSSDALVILLMYMVNVIFYMLVFVMTAKTADTVVQRAIGG